MKKLLALYASLRAARLQRLSTKWRRRSERLLKAPGTSCAIAQAWRGR